MANKSLLAQTLLLSESDRADLAHRLLESLDDVPPAETEQLWAETAVRRASEIDDGKVQLVSAEELEERVASRLT
jgi:putative addiction module component (TIGR02574 family)